MTTIVADLRDGSIYTDSRATYTSIRWTWKGRKKKIVGFEKSMKVFNLKGLLCARVGDVRGSNAIISLLEKKTYHENHKRVWKTLEGHSGGVVIVRPGYCIHLRVDDCGTMCRKVFFGNTNIRAFGSGCGAAILRNIGRNVKSNSILTKPVLLKIMKYNSLFDVYSDDEVVYSNQTLDYFVY